MMNSFELGATSLLATQLISRIRGRISIERFSSAGLFERPTIALLGERMKQESKVKTVTIPMTASCP